MSAEKYNKLKKTVSIMSIVLLLVFAAFMTIGAVKLLAQTDKAAVKTQTAQQETSGKKAVSGWAAIAAGIAVGLGSIGAGIAVGQVGAAAMGVIGEKPELLGKTLIYLGLAEGIAIYGLVIAILLLLT